MELEFIQPENILRAATSVDTFFVDLVRTTDSQGQGIVFRWANTANGSRTQDARPTAAADHIEDSNCPTAAINAAKPSPQHYPEATIATDPPAHFDTLPPVMPQLVLLEPPLEA